MTEEGVRIEVRNLTKRFPGLTAVDDLSFTVEPGRITGFLGPNGAGKTTTLRILLGLVRATSGSATIGGVDYHAIPVPLQTVGSALEATGFHPGRSGRDHLRVLADTAGAGRDRVEQLLQLVGIPQAAGKRAGGYSMGMRQRLGLAGALIGDPRVLVLDEPTNGLDPEGIRWLRGFLRHMASEGRTVLVSSHLLQEVEQTVDDVVIIAGGRAVTHGPMSQLRGTATSLVRTPEPGTLAATLGEREISTAPQQDGALLAHTGDLALIGDAALAAGLPVHELRHQTSGLEDLYFRLTEGAGRDPGNGTAPASVSPQRAGASTGEVEE